MDPLSAFGLAVNVLSVVDISKSFLETLGQVKDAGSSAATRDIASIGRSLQASSAKIASQSLTTGDDEVKLFRLAFKDLVDECMNLSKELIDLGEELSVASSGKLMTKVKITARSMWSHSKIQEKKARLEAIRGQLLFDIVVPMAAKIITIPDTAAMDAQTRTLLDEIKAGEDANSAMEKRLRAFHEEYAAVQDERHIEVVSLLQQIRNAKQKFVTREIEDNNLGTDETVSKKKALKRLIRSLYFRQESDRFHDINPAHKEMVAT
ncbi:hypothetical protein K4K54_011456 [Colletotrichum sp. SAR 10_86]|nr:hypothetical protein K4K54_011456 [Colletotrichum sp. SAR 10_86]